jgi:hypothetical protein
MEDSQTNNLLQLADYVAGVTNRYLQGAKQSERYRIMISSKEKGFDLWPKKKA